MHYFASCRFDVIVGWLWLLLANISWFGPHFLCNSYIYTVVLPLSSIKIFVYINILSYSSAISFNDYFVSFIHRYGNSDWTKSSAQESRVHRLHLAYTTPTLVRESRHAYNHQHNRTTIPQQQNNSTETCIDYRYIGFEQIALDRRYL